VAACTGELHIRTVIMSMGILTPSAQELFDTYAMYGWSGSSFDRASDKEACRSALLELEKEKWEEDLRIMDENNPDALLFI
jgi:hypothetical protein